MFPHFARGVALATLATSFLVVAVLGAAPPPRPIPSSPDRMTVSVPIAATLDRFMTAVRLSFPPIAAPAPTPPTPSASRIMIEPLDATPAKISVLIKRPAAKTHHPAKPRGSGGFRTASTSWYGPGFYGHRTACGLKYTKTILGVASRTLPCGTLVELRNPVNGRTIVVPVIDRGPYVYSRLWDLSAGTAIRLGHLYTGPLQWRIVHRR